MRYLTIFRVRQRGVTLLELMIVVVVFGMMAAIAIPSYQGYAERSRTQRALADLSSLHLSLKVWELNSGSLPESLADANLDGLEDPWGNPYRYLNIASASIGQVRKDRNLVPINTDFDLYSMGPDGQSRSPLTARASRDDIIRANNGSYFGLAEDY